MTAIKAIIFDFGQVLNAPVDPKGTAAHRAELATRIGLEPDALWPYLFEGQPAQWWFTGQIGWEAFWREVLEPLGMEDPDEQDAFGRSVFKGTEQLHPEMGALLRELDGRYKLAVLSNATWSEPQLRSKLAEEYGLPADLFDVVVSSAAVGVAKPDPRIYRITLSLLGAEPAEAIFTDDLPGYAAAAARLGIHTFLFTTPAAFRAHLVEMGLLPAGASDEDRVL